MGLHQKTSNFMKKLSIGNKESIDDDNEQNEKKNHYDFSPNIISCLHCPKVFRNAKFLIDHTHRRHPEELLLTYKKCLAMLNSEPDYNSNNLKSLMCYFENKFSVIHNELISVKKSIKNHNSEEYEVNDTDFNKKKSKNFSCVSEENDTNFNKKKSKNCSCVAEENDTDFYKKKSKNFSSVSDIHTNIEKLNTTNESNFSEIENLKENEVIEYKFQCLDSKIEEMQKTLNNENSIKEEFFNQITDKMCENQENLKKMLLDFKSDILQECQSMLYGKLEDYDDKLQCQISELKQLVEMLDYTVDSLTHKVNSPEYLTETKKKLEEQILYFLENTKKSKHKVLPNRHSRIHKLAEQRKSMNKKRKMSVIDFKDFNKTNLEIGTHNTETQKYNEETKVLKTAQTHQEKHIKLDKSCHTLEDISCKVAEKMLELEIDPNVTRLSCLDYTNKAKLLNSYKEQLKKQPNFEETYNKISKLADHMTNTALKQKRSKKLRFSEPLTLDKKSHEESHNKTIPSQTINESPISALSSKEKDLKFSADIGASGDCNLNFSHLMQQSKQHLESSRFEDLNNENLVSNNLHFPILNHDNSVTRCVNTKINCVSNELLENSDTDQKYSSSPITSQKSSPIKPSIDDSKSFDKDNFDNFDDASSLESLNSWEDK